MESYYLKENTFPEANSSVKLTFVGTLLQSVTFSFIFFSNMLYPFLGPRRLLALGTAVMSFGLVLAGMATSIWQLYFALGLLTGAGASSIGAIAFRILPNWFQKYRSTVCGMQASVTQLGAFTLPHIMVPINKTLGASWTFRILALVFCATNAVALTIIRDRKDPANIANERKTTFDFSVLKNFNLILWMVIQPLQLYATYIAYTFAPLCAASFGLSDTQGATIVSVMAGANCIGKIIAGLIADKYGNLNMYAAFMAVATVALWIIWVFARNFGELLLFAAIFGFFGSTFPSITAPVTLAIVGPKKYPAAAGIRAISLIVTVFGPLFAARLESASHYEPFLYCKLIAGAGTAVCCLLTLYLKLRMERRPLAAE